MGDKNKICAIVAYTTVNMLKMEYNKHILKNQYWNISIPIYYKSKKGKGEVKMKKYVCEPCGYEYDPEVGDPDGGIEPGTAFDDLPEDWVCPICGMGKDVFVEMED